MIDDSCIFCSLANSKIPTNVVYEDEMVCAFEDANPMMPVHVLIVPKDHYSSLNDEIPEDVLGHALATVKKIAEIKGITESGYRVMVNTGDDACQTVHHLHIHVLGGAPMTEGSPRA